MLDPETVSVGLASAMSKVKHAIIADEELFMNGVSTTTAAEVDSAIHLGGGQEWDDTVLIRGWEAAKEEFHLHHPGPGSWLDKATAALSVGTALSGAKHGDSEWYSATSAVPSSSSTSAAAQADRVKHSKRKADGGSAASSKRARVESPSFAPASPSAADFVEDEVEYEEAEEEDEDVDFEIYDGPEASGSYPAPYSGGVAGQPTGMEDALQKSMQAQWWAGYWYGFYASQAAATIPTASTAGDREPSWATSTKSPYDNTTTQQQPKPKRPYKAHKARRAAKIAEHETKAAEGETDGGLVEPGSSGENAAGTASVGSALKR